MGSMKDLDVIRRNIERAQSAAETAAYEADNARSEAGDASDNISSVSSILDELASDIDAIVGFDRSDLERVISDTQMVYQLLDLYISNLNLVLDGHEYDKHLKAIVNAIMLVTTSEGYGHLKFDSNYEIATEFSDTTRYVFRKKEVSNG